jgi:hypothetical protein
MVQFARIVLLSLPSSPKVLFKPGYRPFEAPPWPVGLLPPWRLRSHHLAAPGLVGDIVVVMQLAMTSLMLIIVFALMVMLRKI